MTRTLDPLPVVASAEPEAPASSSAAASSAMDRYASGDGAAFGELYDLLAPRLYAYLLRQTRNGTRAEDLVQQAFLQMHCARGRFIAGADVVPWAFAIARRLMIDGMRRGKREVLSSQDDESVGGDAVATGLSADEAVHAKQIAARIQRELARLPESQRVAFELVKQDGLSMAEAADVLGISVSAVKLRAHRTYEALRAVLGDLVSEGGP